MCVRTQQNRGLIQNEVDIIRTNAVLSTKYFMLSARIESLIAGESIETVLLRATVGFRINMTEILKGCGFSHVYTAVDEKEVKRGPAYLSEQPKSAMVICAMQDSRADLGRTTVSPPDNKNADGEKKE